jgi:hypothetical protein
MWIGITRETTQHVESQSYHGILASFDNGDYKLTMASTTSSNLSNNASGQPMCPVQALHKLWHTSRPGKSGKSSSDLVEWKSRTKDSMEVCTRKVYCTDVYSQESTKCSCCFQHRFSPEEEETIAQYLVDFAILSPMGKSSKLLADEH